MIKCVLVLSVFTAAVLAFPASNDLDQLVDDNNDLQNRRSLQGFSVKLVDDHNDGERNNKFARCSNDLQSQRLQQFRVDTVRNFLRDLKESDASRQLIQHLTRSALTRQQRNSQDREKNNKSRKVNQQLRESIDQSREDNDQSREDNQAREDNDQAREDNNQAREDNNQSREDDDQSREDNNQVREDNNQLKEDNQREDDDDDDDDE